MLRRDSSLIWLAAALVAGSVTHAMAQSPPLTGSAAFGDWRADKPGTVRLIRPEDLQKPGATPSVASGPHVVARPASAVPQVPDGFKIALFAEGLSGPREMRVAPNGDIFIAETGPGRIRVLRAADGEAKTDCQRGLRQRTQRPVRHRVLPRAVTIRKWVYVANNDSVVRFPYKAGDLKASGKARNRRRRTAARRRPFDPRHRLQPRRQADDGLGRLAQQRRRGHGQGAGRLDRQPRARRKLGRRDRSRRRAGVRSRRQAARRVRHRHPQLRRPRRPSETGDLYCSTNERDGLGDNLVPDYVTRVREGAFYGWPWFYSATTRTRGTRASAPTSRTR